MSRYAFAALLCALSLTIAASPASAKVSKNCTLLSKSDVGRPVSMPKLKITVASLPNPSLTGAKGTLTLCDFVDASPANTGTVASMATATLGSNAAAKKEWSAQIHAQRKRGTAKKMSGPWNDGYWFGANGISVLKGRHIFHLEYATGLKRFSAITQRVLGRLAGRAVGRL